MDVTVSLSIETQTWPLAVELGASYLLTGHRFHVLWNGDTDLQMVSAGQLLYNAHRKTLPWPVIDYHNWSALRLCHLLEVLETTLDSSVPSTELYYVPNTCQLFF